MTNSPKAAGFFMPAEWVPHEMVWLAWPSAAHLWLENLKPAQKEFIQFCREVADIASDGQARGEKLNVIVASDADIEEARTNLAGLPVTIEVMPYGDIWLRDTSCLFFTSHSGERAYARTAFNGWGEKYVLPFDHDLGLRIAKKSGLSGFETRWILEGGSVELDGEGTCLTSRQCLLNPNRNKGKSEAEVEAFLKDWLGCEKVLWLNDGLLNDHTDGHIDTMARYVAPGVIAVMHSNDESDPNFAVMNDMISDLEQMTDAKGRKIKVVRIPSPGAVLNQDDEVMPASYLNFYIGNTTVVVPTYQVANDNEAVRAIAECFPDRRTVGVSARAILSGGGAFHCMSQQVPVGTDVKR